MPVGSAVAPRVVLAFRESGYVAARGKRSVQDYPDSPGVEVRARAWATDRVYGT